MLSSRVFWGHKAWRAWNSPGLPHLRPGPRPCASQAQPAQESYGLSASSGLRIKESERATFEASGRSLRGHNNLLWAYENSKLDLGKETPLSAYNSLLYSAYCCDDLNLAISVMQDMLENTILPDAESFDILGRLISTPRSGAMVSWKPQTDLGEQVRAAKTLFKIAQELNVRLSIESYNCFLTAFGIFGKDDVVPILNEIKRHYMEANIQSYHILLTAYWQRAAFLADGWAVFSSFQLLHAMNNGHAPVRPDKHAYNIVLWMFFDLRQYLKAHRVFHEMLTKRVKPDFLTYAAMLEVYRGLAESPRDYEGDPRVWAKERKARERSMIRDGITWDDVDAVLTLHRYLHEKGEHNI